MSAQDTSISELSEDRSGASPVSVSVRVSADRQRLLAQADVWPEQVRVSLWQVQQRGQIHLRSGSEVR